MALVLFSAKFPITPRRNIITSSTIIRNRAFKVWLFCIADPTNTTNVQLDSRQLESNRMIKSYYSCPPDPPTPIPVPLDSRPLNPVALNINGAQTFSSPTTVPLDSPPLEEPKKWGPAFGVIQRGLLVGGMMIGHAPQPASNGTVGMGDHNKTTTQAPISRTGSSGLFRRVIIQPPRIFTSPGHFCKFDRCWSCLHEDLTHFNSPTLRRARRECRSSFCEVIRLATFSFPTYSTTSRPLLSSFH